MSALILALVASICLAVVPQNLTNEYKSTDGVTQAATEVIDGITYNTVYLSGDNADNISKVFGGKGLNYRYVMTADWVYSGTGNIIFSGQHIIFDFAGYTIDTSANQGGALMFDCSGNVTITDSSAAQTGRVLTHANTAIYATWNSVQNFYITGGNCDHCEMHFYAGNIYFSGGNYFNDHTGNTLVYRESPASQTINFAPYMTPTYSSTGKLLSVTRNPDYQSEGVTYQTIYLTGDNTTNTNKISACNQNRSGNYRYVMTADWVPSGTTNFYGNAIIFDLNGCTYSAVAGNYLIPHSKTFEITDSSAEKNGTIAGNGTIFLAVFEGTSTQEVIISGGNMTNGKMHLYESSITFRGGNYINNNLDDSQGLVWRKDHSTQKLTIAPWCTAANNHVGVLGSITTPDYFAVSTSPQVSGVYNYIYGLAWELTDLSQLTMPTDKIYYLWGRGKDGWYEYQNVVYRDGAWVRVA